MSFMRTFLLVLFTSAVVLVGGFLLLERQRLSVEQAERSESAHSLLASARRGLEAHLDAIRDDLLTVGSLGDIRRLVDTPGAETYAQAADTVISLMTHHEELDQVRWIDLRGHERLRGQMTPTGPVIIPDEQLQDKSQRDYVIAGEKLTREQISLSALDLNVEHGEVERPLKPMLRLLTPVYGDDSQRDGLLVINIKAATLLDELLDILEEAWGEPMVLNQASDWIYHQDDALRWGGQLGHEQRFADGFPDAWAAIQHQREGEVLTPEGWFFFTSLPLSVDRLWLISHVSSEVLGLHPWRDHRAPILALLGVAMVFSLSITVLYRRAHREAVRRRSEGQLFASLFRSSPEATLLVDRNGVIVRANARVGELFNYPTEDLLGQPVEKLIPARMRQHHQQHRNLFMQEPSAREMSTRLEIFGLTGEGEEIPLQVALSPLDLPDGHRVLSTVRDLRTQRQAERILQQARHAAESANKAKSQFLTTMSHEIRTPLNAVIGFAELLRRQTENPDSQRYADGIMASSHNLLRLINDILDLSKIEAGLLSLAARPTDLPKVCHEIVQIFAVMAEQKGLELVVDLSPELPQQLMLDETRVRQILLNLLGNAVKFTDAGSIRLRVYGQPGEDVAAYLLTLEISDTGIGISEAEQTRVFDAFSQVSAKNTQHPMRGAGLGLAITRRLVNLMEGQLSLLSQAGEGSVFRVNLPTTVVEARAMAPVVEPSRHHIRFHPARILLVEDIAVNREVVMELLADQPLEFVQAENGEQALILCRETPPDLVLMDMDMRMPVMDGYVATRRLKATPTLAAIPVVALTAAGLTEEQHTIEGLCDAYLRKPITLERLLDVLARFLPVNQPSLLQTPQVVGVSPAALVEYPMPAVVIQRFREHFLPLFHEIRTVRAMKRLKSFAWELQDFATIHQLDWLGDYGERLSNAVASYRIAEINRLLEEFQGIILRVLDAENSLPNY